MQDLFLDINFPSTNCMFLRSSIEFFTNVQIAKNGFETRMILGDLSRNKFLLEETILSISTVEKISNFFKIVKGRGYAFRFKDVLDFKVENANLISVNEGIFLGKKYEYEGYNFEKRILNPVKNTVEIYYLEEKLTEESDYIINYNTGEVSLLNTNYVGSLLKSSFEFDNKVRFDSDELVIARDLSGNLYIKNLVLLEVLN